MGSDTESIEMEYAGMLRERQSHIKRWLKGPYKLFVGALLAIFILSQYFLNTLIISVWVELAITIACFILPLPIGFIKYPSPKKLDAAIRVHQGSAEHQPKILKKIEEKTQSS